eukprot:5290343-Amphidinium_carterae.1
MEVSKLCWKHQVSILQMIDCSWMQAGRSGVCSLITFLAGRFSNFALQRRCCGSEKVFLQDFRCFDLQPN